MGARSGNNYLSALKKLDAEAVLDGERIKDVTTHPALRNCAHSIASLYDMQLEHPEALTFRTEDGGRAGMSFIQAISADDLRRRSRMMADWANFSGGFLTSTPDYINAAIAAMAAAHGFFAESEPRFGDNIRSYYRLARDNDWCAAHTLSNPQVNAAGSGQIDDARALKMVDRTSDGIIVAGCRMPVMLAPMAEELIVFPEPALNSDLAERALFFAINCNAKGLKIICRESYDIGQSRFDAPLATRFDETDCTVVFDNVHVPWGRVFLCSDIQRCNALYEATGAIAHMVHQRVVRDIAKSEFMLALATRIAQAGGTTAAEWIRDRLAEAGAATEAIRACLRAAFADAAVNQWGICAPARAPLEAARILFARLYPRTVEVIQTTGSFSLIAPQEEDLEKQDERIAIDKSLATDADDADEARDRAALYRLAWDATCSAFGARQLLIERLSGSNPATALADGIDLAPLLARVNPFLKVPN